MPKYRIICFSEDVVDVGKLKISVLKPTLEKEVTVGSVIKLDGDEDEVYKKLKEYIYGKECQKLLIASISNTRNEPSEILVNLAGRYNEYILYPRISRVLGLSILERQDTEDIEENVIVAKMLKEQQVLVQNPFFIQEGQLEMSANGNSNIVGVRLITDHGERILLMKEKASKLPKEEKKKKKSKSRRKTRKRMKISKSKKAKSK